MRRSKNGSSSSLRATTSNFRSEPPSLKEDARDSAGAARRDSIVQFNVKINASVKKRIKQLAARDDIQLPIGTAVAQRGRSRLRWCCSPRLHRSVQCEDQCVGQKTDQAARCARRHPTSDRNRRRSKRTLATPLVLLAETPSFSSM